jgi:CheY-like chemotaxis protein
MKILVVDDVGYIRHFLQLGLTKAGHHVLTASDGVEALQHLKSDPGIQVVLTDLIMPAMDGIELFKQSQLVDRFNDNGPVPPPAFFLMTSLRPSNSLVTRDATRLQDAVAIGFVAVFTKPVAIDELNSRLKQLENEINDPNAKGAASATALLERLNDLMAMMRSTLGETALKKAKAQLTAEATLIESRLKELHSAAAGS